METAFGLQQGQSYLKTLNTSLIILIIMVYNSISQAKDLLTS